MSSNVERFGPPQRSWPSSIGCFLIATLVGSWSWPAHASEGDSRRQAAEALFQQGKELLEAGQAQPACAKFEASQALDEGLGTLLFLGECYEKIGRTASAWRAFSAAAKSADRLGDARRGGLARIRVAALEPVLAKLRVRAAAQTQTLTGLELRLDGEVFAKDEFDQLIAVDPGPMTIEATAPEHERWQTQLDIREGPSSAVVDIPRLTPIATLVEPAALPQHTEAVDLGLEPAAHGGRGFATWAIVLGSVGLVGVGTGAYLGHDAVSLADDSRQRRNCPLDDRCYAEGLKLRDEARSRAHLADIVAVSGGVLLIGGAILYLVAPDPAENPLRGGTRLSLAAGPGLLGVNLGARF